MISVNDLFGIFVKNNVTSYYGVPDSLLKDLVSYLSDNVDESNHIISANEGNAVSLACGHYLSSSNIAVVYMQNSGLGNAINPILSLSDELVYNIPFLMLIGNRGEKGITDEPQHIKQGRVTEKLLKTIDIKYSILSNDINEAEKTLDNAFKYMHRTKKPYAIIVRKDTFFKYNTTNIYENTFKIKREDAISQVLKSMTSEDIIISSTGHISRELFELREINNQSHCQDFLTVGSMGHSSSIALAIALEKPHRKVYCLDGDGSMLMHMGSLPVISSRKPNNFTYILFNNMAHDSVGGQKTVAGIIDFISYAKSIGINKVYSIDNFYMIDKVMCDIVKSDEVSFIEIKVALGTRENLGRPNIIPTKNKQSFMKFINPQEVYCYRNSLMNLKKIIIRDKYKRILVFRGKKSFLQIKKEITPCLVNLEYYDEYSDFSTNPKYEDVITATISNPAKKYDLILAIGGGSVIDFAKAYNYYLEKRLPLIAIPTTAGTGSEATQFAVIYKDGIKQSLDEKILLPDIAIIDSRLVMSDNSYLKACTAMDAFCQSIESYWAVKSTKESKEYAKKCLELCKVNLVKYVLSNDAISAENMALAAYYSGKAINISRTTAAHAFSYRFTNDYNIPHGHAVALSIAGVFALNMKVNEKCCQDDRGVGFVKDTLQEILSILQINEHSIVEYFRLLMKKIGLEWSLSQLGIVDIKNVVKSVDKERLFNNPVDINDEIYNVWDM